MNIQSVVKHDLIIIKGDQNCTRVQLNGIINHTRSSVLIVLKENKLKIGCLVTLLTLFKQTMMIGQKSVRRILRKL